MRYQNAIRYWLVWAGCVATAGLGCLSAFAEPPAVSNVTFTQGPNGALGTKVDILYDLASPSGNCTVTAKLSKDNGATFPFDITTATGDIGANVTPATGKHIVWNMTADDPNQTIAHAKIRIIADLGVPAVEMVPVAAGTFLMGNSGVGDDYLLAGGADYELPQHDVALGAYRIGKFEVTNVQYATVLNWAHAKGYLKDIGGNTWSGTGDLYAGGPTTKLILKITDSGCCIQYSGAFSSTTRAGRSMDSFPVLDVSWYGSVCFCQWMSEWSGLTPCYNLSTWTLTVAPPTSGGYRLPTEAEWERAAAWDGSKHWIYGMTSDTVGREKCNMWGNPVGMPNMPYSSPVGWYDGVNMYEGTHLSVSSVSPVGCYDMTGNVEEWCHDWFSTTYYSTGGPTWTNPVGPNGPDPDPYWPGRVVRGGYWEMIAHGCRTAFREGRTTPDSAGWGIGFRAATSGSAAITAGTGDSATGAVLDTVSLTANITLVTPPLTRADAVAFAVHFSEVPATPLTAAEISLTPGSLAGVISVSGTNTDYVVTITLLDPDGDGTVGITLSGTAIADSLGNLYAGGPSPSYVIAQNVPVAGLAGLAALLGLITISGVRTMRKK